MITVFYRQNNATHSLVLEHGEPLPEGAIWIDLLSPSEEEMEDVERQLSISIPTRKEVWKNHILNRLYIEDGVSYMTAAIITKVDSPYPGTSPVTFILGPSYLLTVHDIAPTSFRNFADRLLRPGVIFRDAQYLFEGLLEEMITRVAYNSELVVDTLDSLSHSIFGGEVLEDREARNPSKIMKKVLTQLGAAADLNSKINESLHSINRLLVFFKQVVPTDHEIDCNIDVLIADTTALTTQCAFLSDKITFQLDATLGMINIEQNLIVKIFSVVAVFFMPPTLVTSMYGMNFQHMPELGWMFGYPYALGLMALCAIVPYIYFRKKGWL